MIIRGTLLLAIILGTASAAATTKGDIVDKFETADAPTTADAPSSAGNEDRKLYLDILSSHDVFDDYKDAFGGIYTDYSSDYDSAYDTVKDVYDTVKDVAKDAYDDYKEHKEYKEKKDEKDGYKEYKPFKRNPHGSSSKRNPRAKGAKAAKAKNKIYYVKDGDKVAYGKYQSSDGWASSSGSAEWRETPSPTWKPSYRPTKNPTKKPSWKPSWKPTPDPTAWSGDSWSGDDHDRDASTWSGDSYHSEDSGDYVWSGDDNDEDVCQTSERETCCTQSSSLTYDEKEDVCDKLGCNLKKCSKRSWSSSSWDDGDKPTLEPTLSPHETSWSGDEHSEDVWSGDEHSSSEDPEAWSSDGHDITVRTGSWSGDSFDECRTVEKEACCDQPDDRPYAAQEGICDSLGCNIKKCDKGRFASTTSEWSGDDHDDSGDDEWSGDDHDDVERSGDGWKTDGWRSADTPEPSKDPTKKPTWKPSWKPTSKPSSKPSYRPTKKPTKKPTSKPSWKPTPKPSRKPTWKPSWSPSKDPTKKPTSKPSWSPSKDPTKKPTSKPSRKPTNKPTNSPTGWNGSDRSYHSEDSEPWLHDGFVDDDPDKCTTAEKMACCDQPSSRSYDKQYNICSRLGCKIKKCDKQRDDDDNDKDDQEYKKPSDGGYSGGVFGHPNLDHFTEEKSEDCDIKKHDDHCIKVCTHWTKIMSGGTVIDESVKTTQTQVSCSD